VLVELKLVEQRYRAVIDVLDGMSVTDVARRNKVSRQSVHAWLRRYANGGMAALADKSSKPETCPHQMPPVVEALTTATWWTLPGTKCQAGTGASVAQVPEPRLKVSGRYRSHAVKHEPEFHNRSSSMSRGENAGENRRDEGRLTERPL
jgi:hypothetical protein